MLETWKWLGVPKVQPTNTAMGDSADEGNLIQFILNDLKVGWRTLWWNHAIFQFLGQRSW